MLLKSKIILILLLVLSLANINCKKSDVPKNGGTPSVEEPYLSVSADSLSFSSKIIRQDLKITSNAAWSIKTTDSRLSLSDTTGTGTKNIVITYVPDENNDEKTGKILIDSKLIKKEIKVFFNPPVILISATGTAPLSDSITLTFNKPIQVVNIVSHLETCQPQSMGYRYLNNNTQVRFSYTCSRLGEKYSFTSRVKDERNEEYTNTFEVKFFTGIIENPFTDFYHEAPEYFISPDNKYLWFLGFDDYTLFKISLADFQIVNRLKMDFKLRHMRLNSYNKLLYLLSTDNKIRIFDPEAMAIKETIEVKHAAGESESFPINLPYAINFTSSGLGILACASEEGWLEWRLIDSKKNHEIYYMTNRPAGYQLSGLSFVSPDRKKLYVLNDADNWMYTFDGYTMGIKREAPPIGGNLLYLIPNKKNGLMWFAQRNEQYLYNASTSYLSKASYIERGFLADFTYRTGEEETMYTFDPFQNFRILDYKTGLTRITFRSMYGYTADPVTSTDGKHLVVYNNEKLYYFDSKMFPLK